MEITKHSKLGKTSFIFSIISITFFFLVLIDNYFHVLPEYSDVEGVYLFFFVGMLLHLLPLASVLFGTLCLFQKKCEKNNAIIGLVISGIQLISVTILYY